jgi:excinuclease ABC subunit A
VVNAPNWWTVTEIPGGEILAVGTSEQVAKEPRSYTARYLAPLLGIKAKREQIAAE